MFHILGIIWKLRNWEFHYNKVNFYLWKIENNNIKFSFQIWVKKEIHVT